MQFLEFFSSGRGPPQGSRTFSTLAMTVKNFASFGSAAYKTRRTGLCPAAIHKSLKHNRTVSPCLLHYKFLDIC